MKPTPEEIELLRGIPIALLMGGPGAEREVSLRSGAAVAEAFRSLGCQVEEVDVRDEKFVLPDRARLACNMIHGTFGEDGQIQSILDRKGIPYTGDDAASSHTAFDKILSKRCFEAAGVPTAPWEVIRRGEKPSMDIPLVLKPPREGSSVGIVIVRKPEQLESGLEEAFRYDDELLVEKFVEGRELTVGIVDDTALPIIEIRPKSGVYDYRSKYTKGETEYLVPAPLDEETTRRVQEAALAAHRSLGLRIYSRVDALLAEDGSIAVMEANTIPGMTETSLLPKAAACYGVSFSELCARLALLALKGGKKAP